MCKDSITLTVKKDLCTSCEICKFICPNNAITMVFKRGQQIPVVDKKKCVCCGICLKLCPGIKKKEYVSEKNVSCYVGQTTNKKILLNSSSGGLVTTMVQHLIRSKKFDFAFLVKEIDYDKKKVDFIVTNNLKEIFNSAKSKYIPVSIENIICFLDKHPNKRCVFVGTPCQFLAIKNYIKFKKLNLKNYLFLGLFCAGVLNYNFIDYVRKRFVKKEHFLKIDYRNKENTGWPGHLKIYLSNKDKIINRKERLKVKNYFTLTSCYKCNDKFNYLADISFGDCYIEGKEDKEGISNIIIRDKKYLNLIPKTISLEEISYKKIEESQIFKKQKPINFIGKYKFYFLIPFSNFLFKFIKYTKIIINSFKKKDKVVKKDKVIVVGGGFENKGALAMLCTVTTRLEKNKRNYSVFLSSNLIQPKDSIYVTSRDKLKIILFENTFYNNSQKFKNIINILRSANRMYDISGFALSSDLRFKTNLGYLLNIFLCKKYNLEMIVCPQSIGPFKYRFLFKFIIYYFIKKINKVYIREQKYLSNIKKLNNTTEYCPDIVLLNKGYNTQFLIKSKKKALLLKNNNLGIVPNKRVFERNKKMNVLYKKLLSKFSIKNIYLIKHSLEDDFKNLFKKVTVIESDYNPKELENIICQCDILIASRYHSIIHAYRNGVPCIILGWANKYKELAGLFNQEKYYFDCRDEICVAKVISKVDLLLKNRLGEKKIILYKLNRLRSKYKLDFVK